MTTRTRTPLVCACGHKGAHIHSENDQPFSASWDSYRLEGGFSGGGEEHDDLATIFCPNCGKTGKVRYA
jgi:hypothetical protein